ncbi:hypothetical protein ACLOJK_005392 [Asimina triloba]
MQVHRQRCTTGVPAEHQRCSTILTKGDNHSYCRRRHHPMPVASPDVSIIAHHQRSATAVARATVDVNHYHPKPLSLAVKTHRGGVSCRVIRATHLTDDDEHNTDLVRPQADGVHSSYPSLDQWQGNSDRFLLGHISLSISAYTAAIIVVAGKAGIGRSGPSIATSITHVHLPRHRRLRDAADASARDVADASARDPFAITARQTPLPTLLALPACITCAAHVA